MKQGGLASANPPYELPAVLSQTSVALEWLGPGRRGGELPGALEMQGRVSIPSGCILRRDNFRVAGRNAVPEAAKAGYSTT